MKQLCHAAGFVACALIAAQPAFAAEDRRDLTGNQMRGAAFAGGSLRVPLGRAASGDRTTARLQFTPHYLAGEGTRTGRGLELAIGASGKPSLHLGGQSSGEVERKLALKGSGKYLVIGGVLLLVLVLAAVASAAPTPGPDGDDF